MLYRPDRLSCLGGVFLNGPVTHQLLSGEWVLPLGKSGEVFGIDRAEEAESLPGLGDCGNAG